MDFPVSPNVQNELLDMKIQKTKQQFYQELARKKRNIKRHWMEINAVTNSHFLQQLPYRAMLNHVKDLTAERRSGIQEKAVHSLSEVQVGAARSTDEESVGRSHDEVLEDEFASDLTDSSIQN